MRTIKKYNGNLTGEQFFFSEMRIVAKKMCENRTPPEIVEECVKDNAFQYPTERKTARNARACIYRLNALEATSLINTLAYGDIETAKQVNLLAMIKHNRLVDEFLKNIIGEKLHNKDFSFSNADINSFFTRLAEQNDDIAKWSDTTISKIKQVLKKSLVEVGLLANTKSTELIPIGLIPELQKEVFPCLTY